MGTDELRGSGSKSGRVIAMSHSGLPLYLLGWTQKVQQKFQPKKIAYGYPTGRKPGPLAAGGGSQGTPVTMTGPGCNYLT